MYIYVVDKINLLQYYNTGKKSFQAPYINLERLGEIFYEKEPN